MEPRPAIGPPMDRMHEAQTMQQPDIFGAARRQRAVLPSIEPTAPDAQTTTEDTDWIVRLLRGDKLKSHSLCLAKKAVAFFKISRSIRSSRFSLRSRFNSVRSSSVSGISGFGRLASTHLRRVEMDTPRSRAIKSSDSSELRARCTASARNSAEYIGRRCRAMWTPLRIVRYKKVSTKVGQAHSQLNIER